MEYFRLLLGHLAWIKHQFLSGISDSRKAGSLWGMMRGVGGVRKSIHQSLLAKGLGLGLLCWGFKGVQEEILSEQASTLQIGSVAFPPGQCTSSQLHPCHRLFDQDDHQESSSASLKSRPCSLWLLVIPWAQRLSLWDNWDERGCDEGRWHAHTRGLLWGLAEVVRTVQQVHCSRRRLLLRGQEFHVCTINKSAHTKKRSGNLFNDPRMSRVKCRFIAIIPRSNLIQSWLYLLGSYIGQVDLFKNYSHLIGLWAKWSHLLWRGLEFHVCTINKSGHTKKKSGNLFNDPRIR